MKRIVALCLAAACLISMVGCAGDTNMDEKKPNNSASAYALALASYPEMAPYPNEMEYFDEKTGEFDSDGLDVVYDAWQSDRKAQRSQPEGYADGLEPFFASSIREFLSNSNGENKVYSPLSVYMALAMLAEVTDSESRQQILDLLGSESIEALRSQAASVWNANYSNDGAVTSILANSLWLNESVNFNQSTMDSLAKNYYASSFRGEMGSEEFNQALRDWINEQTGGLLEAQADGLSMDPETVMALASTIYYRAKWHSEFNEAGTEKGLFHLFSADGETVECDFMDKGGSNTYYWADQFGAVALSLEGSGKMWFLLPDDGVAKADPADQFIGKAYSQRFSTEDRFGDRFLEIAETVAKGRALADAGYGTQFCMNGEALASIIADAPIKMPPDEDAGHPGSVVASFTAQPTADPPVFSQTATAPKSTQPAQQQVQPPVQQSHAPAPEPPKTLDEYLRVMTIEQAKAVKVDFGRFSGWSLGEIAMKSPGDLAWYVKNYSGHNLALKAGATKLLETVGQMAS